MKPKENPLVTVVTVCFNLITHARVGHFEQCLLSVNLQDYPHVEHLVIDGGSQDGTLELLQKYADRGWIRYVSEPDSGIYDAMNKGIRLAKGKYVAFLNSDDYWHHRRAVSASVAALEQGNAAFSYAPRTIVQENGTFMCAESPALGAFLQLMPFCHQTMFTRRELLLAYGGFDAAQYRSAADYDLVFRLLLGGESGVFVPLNFTSFRLGGYSVACEEISHRECHQIRRRHLGVRVACRLRRGVLDEAALLHLLDRVHPRVAMELLRAYTESEPGAYRLMHGPVRRCRSEVKPCLGTGISRQRFSLKLLHFIPLLVCRLRPNRQDWYLLGFLPLLRLRRRGSRTSIRLFFLLPVAEYEHSLMPSRLISG